MGTSHPYGHTRNGIRGSFRSAAKCRDPIVKRRKPNTKCIMFAHALGIPRANSDDESVTPCDRRDRGKMRGHDGSRTKRSSNYQRSDRYRFRLSGDCCHEREALDRWTPNAIAPRAK